jgi:hypothetical protein
MERELREFLRANFKSLAMLKGKAALHGGLGARLNLDRYLSLTNEEFDKMEADLEARIDRSADEMLDELEARHFETEEDVHDRADELGQVTEAYMRKVIQSVK